MTDPISEVRAVAELVRIKGETYNEAAMCPTDVGDFDLELASRLTAAADAMERERRDAADCERVFQDRIAAKDKTIAELDQIATPLLQMTKMLEAHPEGYDGPCFCKLCQSCEPKYEAEP